MKETEMTRKKPGKGWVEVWARCVRVEKIDDWMRKEAIECQGRWCQIVSARKNREICKRFRSVTCKGKSHLPQLNLWNDSTSTDLDFKCLTCADDMANKKQETADNTEKIRQSEITHENIPCVICKRWTSQVWRNRTNLRTVPSLAEAAHLQQK
jgi:hypothetical protein